MVAVVTHIRTIGWREELTLDDSALAVGVMAAKMSDCHERCRESRICLSALVFHGVVIRTVFGLSGTDRY